MRAHCRQGPHPYPVHQKGRKLITGKNTKTNLKLPESEIDLARLGLGEVAYVRKVPVNEVERMIGRKVDASPSASLYCLYMADGTPVAVSDSHDAAIANALEHDLDMISVH